MNVLLKISLLLLALAVYIIASIVYVVKRSKEKDAEMFMEIHKDHKFKAFFYELVFLRKMGLKPEQVKLFLYIERFVVFGTVVYSFFTFRGIALFIIGAVLITLFFDDAYKKAIYESGISNVPKITNFINYFVPHINSGNSADQSFLGYVDYAKDEELREYYENRDNPDYKAPEHIKQIIDIYDIAKYNEEKGISDYVYILNELSKDMSQKQTYYNGFISRIGEIKPIMWSYYIGVPLLVFISFDRTYSFWMGIGGWICGIVLLILFALFKFLIFRLQKTTITTIF